MQIAIDAITMTSSQPGGYRTYTRNLVAALQALDSENSFKLLVDSPQTADVNANWQYQTLPRTGSFGFIWREQILLSRFLAGEHVDVFHAAAATAPLRSTSPMVVTIYDTIEYSDSMPSPWHWKRWTMRLYSRIVQAKAVQLADHIITISDYSKQQIINRFNVSADRITVTHLAPPPYFRLRNGRSKEAAVHKKNGEFILAIASAAPRKNTGALLRAYTALPKEFKEKYLLILVCTHADVKSKIQAELHKLGLEKYVTMVSGVDDKNLAQLYSSAKLFVFPSLEEGFGMPPLEAMASGTPVIASNTSAMPEVLGDAAILVPPDDVPALEAAICMVLDDPGLAEALREKGLVRSQQFSWQKTALETLKVYKSVA